ncbi:TIGR03086 family metal-binding protein [Streptomyces buecherae]|uniref:TIGR03086 family metal-binding protein n=1 Tax=Streptomyces buecherae TaxID=2763006 RepID=UPI0037B9CB0E
MSQQNAVPDPRPQYERAADQMAALIDAVSPDRWGAPTPCAEFDVRALLGHVVRGTHGAAELGATAARAGAAGAPEGLSGGSDAAADVPDDGWAMAYARARAELAAAWADDAALAAPVRMPWGEVPGRGVLAAHVLDVVAHAWDLARALGDRRPLDPELARVALAGARQMLPAERRGGPVPFGPVRPAPEGADAYEELAAWLGRDASWTAPGARTAADAAAAAGARTLDAAVDALAALVRGPVLRPGDAAYDVERATFNSAVAHRPAVLAGVADAADVSAVVAFAGARGLPVAVQSTGHGQALASADGVLVTTRRLRGVHVDPAAATAWIGAGERWGAVVAAAAEHGLAPLNGSAPHVGVVGYLLGGGISLLARSHGFAADRVRAIEVVTPDAVLRRVTATSEPDLYWALLGGRDNFGVVTRVEVELVPVTRLYGGGLYFDGATQGEAVLRAYRDWSAGLPEALTSSIAFFPAPDAPTVPEPLRGRLVAHVRVVHTGSAEEGERLVEPLRAIGPRLIDTVAEMPYAACASIFNEPADPMPYDGDTVLLSELTPRTLEAILDVTRPGGVPCIAEVRHLGGALARRGEAPNAIGLRDAAYLLGVLSPLRGPLTRDVVRPVHERLLTAAAPVTVGRSLPFMGPSGERAPGAGPEAAGETAGETAADTAEEVVRSAYEAEDYARLRALKATYDPHNLFRHNHNIRPA